MQHPPAPHHFYSESALKAGIGDRYAEDYMISMSHIKDYNLMRLTISDADGETAAATISPSRAREMATALNVLAEDVESYDLKVGDVVRTAKQLDLLPLYTVVKKLSVDRPYSKGGNGSNQWWVAVSGVTLSSATLADGFGPFEIVALPEVRA